jgi:2-(1,2-epoxy-1,2-dihydrophenyl)acetyl-CoA isomerase
VIDADAADPSVRAVLVTGAGRGFSSGADLKAGFDVADDGMPDVAKELNELYHPIVAGIRHLEKPVVAAVNGPAVGIGASLAFACDLVLAAESAYFGLAFVNIGLMPDGGSTLFVPTAVGKARAFQMALLGERIEAQRAVEWGLVNYVHPDDRLLDEANALVERLATGPTRSTGCSTRTSRASSRSRPSCSTASRARVTSRRARSRSWRSANRPSREPEVARHPAVAVGASAIGTRIIGSKAIGALAVGAVALGAVAIGRLAIGSARIKQLRIEELEVGRLRVRELEVESERRPG